MFLFFAPVARTATDSLCGDSISRIFSQVIAIKHDKSISIQRKWSTFLFLLIVLCNDGNALIWHKGQCYWKKKKKIGSLRAIFCQGEISQPTWNPPWFVFNICVAFGLLSAPRVTISFTSDPGVSHHVPVSIQLWQSSGKRRNRSSDLERLLSFVVEVRGLSETWLWKRKDENITGTE